MQSRLRWVGTLLTVVALAVAGCAESGAEAAEGEPAILISPVDGSDVSRLTLSARAWERLGIETADVTERVVDDVERLMIPYAAVLYNADGSAWAYTNRDGFEFIRARLEIVRIAGSEAILADGPAAGTLVVTVGGAELWGAEHGVGGGH